MIRRPPRSTPFPTRRSSDLARAAHAAGVDPRLRRALPDGRRRRPRGGREGDEPHRARSEEHTSELQSCQYLVCRLLLEKKNEHILAYPLSIDICIDLSCRML